MGNTERADNENPSSTCCKFESLGDNCELGVIKRRVNNEESGLLRWAFSLNFDLLVEAIENGFSGFYQFDNLVPWVESMVLDTKYRIGFYSKIHSVLTDTGWTFKEPEAHRREIHAKEMAIFDGLKEGFLHRLHSANRCFVYKRNPIKIEDELAARIAMENGEQAPIAQSYLPTEAQITRLHAALKSYNPANCLMVAGPAFGHPLATVLMPQPGLFLGAMDRLAPYCNAYDTSLDSWYKLLENTDLAVTAYRDGRISADTVV